MPRVVVVGAGINGLVAAFYLRRAGWETGERSPTPSERRCSVSREVFYCSAGAYPCGSVAGTPG